MAKPVERVDAPTLQGYVMNHTAPGTVAAVTVNAAMRGPQPVVLGTGGGFLTCFSTGVLEAEVADAVKNRTGLALSAGEC